MDLVVIAQSTKYVQCSNTFDGFTARRNFQGQDTTICLIGGSVVAQAYFENSLTSNSISMGPEIAGDVFSGVEGQRPKAYMWAMFHDYRAVSKAKFS